MATSTYTDPKAIAASKNCVNVVSHGDTGHGTREVIVNGREKKTWCKEYWGISCDVHVEGGKAVGKFMNGSYGTPTTILCDPDGKEISRKPGAIGGGELVKMITEALAKIPGEKILGQDWFPSKKAITDAEEAFGKEDYKKAIELAAKVAKHKLKGVAALAEETQKKIAEKGEALFEEAKGKVESDKPEAKKLLKKIADTFKGLDVAKKAADLLKELKD